MEMLELMKWRHSVRQYMDKPIEREKRAILDEMTAQINRENGLHIQICYDEPKCFDSFMARYGKFSGVRNYIALVGEKAPDLEEKLGYYGEKLVCLISLGYGKTQGVEHKSKPLGELCNATEAAPDWFLRGMEAALLAPTAMNQQKFFFELQSGGAVKASCGKGFYTKLDLGIVKYHFEAVSGKRIV